MSLLLLLLILTVSTTELYAATITYPSVHQLNSMGTVHQTEVTDSTVRSSKSPEESSSSQNIKATVLPPSGGTFRVGSGTGAQSADDEVLSWADIRANMVPKTQTLQYLHRTFALGNERRKQNRFRMTDESSIVSGDTGANSVIEDTSVATLEPALEYNMTQIEEAFNVGTDFVKPVDEISTAIAMPLNFPDVPPENNNSQQSESKRRRQIKDSPSMFAEINDTISSTKEKNLYLHPENILKYLTLQKPKRLLQEHLKSKGLPGAHDVLLAELSRRHRNIKPLTYAKAFLSTYPLDRQQVFGNLMHVKKIGADNGSTSFKRRKKGAELARLLPLPSMVFFNSIPTGTLEVADRPNDDISINSIHKRKKPVFEIAKSVHKRRRYDVPQIECPPKLDGTERFACPSPDHTARYKCISDHSMCDGFIDCPNAEDEDRMSCMFFQTTKAHLDVLADALLRWARRRY